VREDLDFQPDNLSNFSKAPLENDARVYCDQQLHFFSEVISDCLAQAKEVSPSLNGQETVLEVLQEEDVEDKLGSRHFSLQGNWGRLREQRQEVCLDLEYLGEVVFNSRLLLRQCVEQQ